MINDKMKYLDFYTKKEYRFEMLRAVIGVEVFWLDYLNNWFGLF